MIACGVLLHLKQCGRLFLGQHSFDPTPMVGVGGIWSMACIPPCATGKHEITSLGGVGVLGWGRLTYLVLAHMVDARRIDVAMK